MNLDVRNPRSVVRGLMAGAGVAIAAMSAGLGLLANAAVSSPRFDILGQISPGFAIAAAIAAMVAVSAPRATRNLTLALSATTVLATVAMMAPEFLRPTGPVAPLGSPHQLKVIQFNVWRENRSIVQVADWLQREDPDIVMLEESTPELRNLIMKRTGWSVAGASGNIMIFSRAPYLKMHRPIAARGSSLDWVNATYASPSGPFEVVATHLAWTTDRRHDSQSVDLRNVASALPKDRMVLAGDFNATPWSFSLRRQDDALGLIRRDRALPTWPAHGGGRAMKFWPFPFLPIDHIYAGPGWATTSLRRGPQLGSDHYPLVITLAPVN